MTYFRCPPNFGHRSRRNWNFTESGTVAFGRNWMYAESATWYTFSAETETETEIRSTFSHHCYWDHNSSWYHISRWRRKSTTTILNLRSSTCRHSKRYVQNWKYFRFVVAILNDWFAVDSNSIYLASVSFTSPETYDYSLTSLWCEQHLLNWNYFRFMSAIFISGVTAVHSQNGDMPKRRQKA